MQQDERGPVPFPLRLELHRISLGDPIGRDAVPLQRENRSVSPLSASTSAGHRLVLVLTRGVTAIVGEFHPVFPIPTLEDSRDEHVQVPREAVVERARTEIARFEGGLERMSRRGEQLEEVEGRVERGIAS